MVNNYGRKSNVARTRSGVLKQALLVLVSLVVGYMGAYVCDMTTLSAWVGEHVLSKQDPQVGVKPTTDHVELPKPKLEFYTLLTNERVVASSQVAPVPTPPPAVGTTVVASTPPPTTVAIVDKAPITASVNKNAFLVQIAAFKSRQEADRMRATLMLKGFDVSVVTVSQQTVNWYRVIMGPFASRSLAEKAQLSIARKERITGMIRKMDA